MDGVKGELLQLRFIGKSPKRQTNLSASSLNSNSASDSNSKRKILDDEDDFENMEPALKRLDVSLEKVPPSDEFKEPINLSNFKYLEASLKEKDRYVRSLSENLENCQKQLKDTTDKLKSSQQIIVNLLLDQLEKSKKDETERLMKNSSKVGTYNLVRKGSQYVEEWQNGSAFQRISRDIEENAKLVEHTEKQRKILLRRRSLSSGEKTADSTKNSLAKKRSGDESPLPLRSNTVDNNHEYEILKVRMASLKKEEQELQQKYESLELLKVMHIRELKRVHAEKVSRFNDNPMLNDRYLLLSLVGKGGFSEVYKAYDTINMNFVACKIHQLSNEWKEDRKANYIRHVIREFQIHQTFDHPNIITMLDVFDVDNNVFCMVLEYCDGNDLEHLLKLHRTIPEREARIIIVQIVNALKYLNERKPPVIHYDLKPGNILVGKGKSNWDVKLADFGLSKVFPESSCDVSGISGNIHISDDGNTGMELTSQGAGTYWYLPPECFIVEKNGVPTRISSKVDVWSVGIIFYQCLYGRKPFANDLTQLGILEQNAILKATKVEFPAKPLISKEAKDFIVRCLTYKKEERINVLEMSQHPYIVMKKTDAKAIVHGIPPNIHANISLSSTIPMNQSGASVNFGTNSDEASL